MVDDKLTECHCIDCGGTENHHEPYCSWMNTMFQERDLEAKPYTADEKRVVDYIQKITNGQVGAGDDPIGFILASHAYTMRERTTENAAFKALRESFNFVAKWVERGLFDTHHTPKEALDVIAHYPGMPWKTGRWDVDHKPYASDFYKKFPRAKVDAP